MVLCRRRGCGLEMGPGASGPCRYHPGAPVFHEGLKSWSCCQATNKPVLEFEQFLQLPGCAVAEAHTDEAQALPAQPRKPAPAATEQVAQSLSAIQLSGDAPQARATPAPPRAAEPAPEPRDPDTLTTVAAGTACRRPGCGFVAEAAIAARDRAAESCRYHRGAPIFHEGSKGYACCKRRVLHFDDFLQIEPCTTAEHGHLFAAPEPDKAPVSCRVDHYETPKDVRVTVYAKGVDAEQSTIEIRENEVVLSLLLAPTPSVPHARRFERTLRPYSDVDAPASSYTLSKMKLDLVLVKKEQGTSWPALERDEPVYGYGVTFGRR
ncbi:hypothetical protein MCAP1_002718 [Malassezia caprae]|uniref:Cysteine and histidine-rich domain-containing protein 1 n=1 Tax=Malassezia caprae TaxID=1381934 RepID=A0AAF0E8Y7_9BASI|nr:hypothetical protein MCAP1_002718 [Malassezia caprae]